MKSKPLKDRLYEIIFEADTPAGKLFDILLLVTVVLSVAVTMLSTVEEYRTSFGGVLRGFEWFFTGLFTVEYILRIYCARNPRRYARSFFGVVDLFAVLPTYIGLLLPGTRFLGVVRILRTLRVFRVLKMVQYIGEADTLMHAFANSRRKIAIFLITVLTLVVILGSMMYVIEGEENGFSSIPKGVYWAIVTLTTVGYGDISPQTSLGQTLAAFIMIIGYSIIAVPTGIITAELGLSAAQHKSDRKCSSCGHSQHDADAGFCKSCGEKLS
jgi:voltage-gated potassium channel